jgi:uncharacterized membrane protein YhhN
MATRRYTDRALDAAAPALLVADLACAATGRRRARMMTKPLLTPVLAARLVARSGPRARTARDNATLALTLSAVGDAILLRESDVAVAGGAVCFGAAQSLYTHAFRSVGVRPIPSRAVPIAAIALAGVAGCWPRAGRLRPVVLAYSTALATMAAHATSTAAVLPQSAALRIATGGGVFLLSDALVGAQRFMAPSPRARATLEAPVMLTYFAAQWLLADGVARATHV